MKSKKIKGNHAGFAGELVLIRKGKQMDDNTFYIIVLVVFCLYNYFFSR